MTDVMGTGMLNDADDFGLGEDDELATFEMMEKLGEGTYGQVYKAMHKPTQQVYALKRIKIVYEEEGVPSTAIREISLLKECDHPNVIRLHNVFSLETELVLVFDCLDMDLRGYLKKFGAMRNGQMLRSAAHQCIRGVDFCHGHRILHRDLKPQNVLVDVASHKFKLADFGLARTFTVPLRPYTHEVVTLWYRAPEILLGMAKYASPMDIWSLGCIVSEMASSHALFPGDSEIDMIFKIFRLLGTPDEGVWPGVTELKDFKPTFPKWADTHLVDIQRADATHKDGHGPVLGESGVDLLRMCLRYHPVTRQSARRLLQHAFFDPMDRANGLARVDRAPICAGAAQAPEGVAAP